MYHEKNLDNAFAIVNRNPFLVTEGKLLLKSRFKLSKRTFPLINCPPRTLKRGHTPQKNEYGFTIFLISFN